MTNKFFTRKRKYFLFFSLLLIALIASAVLSPILISNERNDWDRILTDKIDQTESIINQTFERKYHLLINTSSNLKLTLVGRSIKNTVELQKIFDHFINFNDNKLSVQLYDSKNNLIVWNERPVLTKLPLVNNNEWIGQTYFSGEKLITYLTLKDTIKLNDEKLFLTLSLPVEKAFSYSPKNKDDINVADSLSRILSVAVQINYSPFAQSSKDGRKYSFALLNNFKNKIGIVTFDRPSLDASVTQTQNTIWLLQSIILIAAFIGIGVTASKSISRLKLRWVKFIVITCFLIMLRFLLFYFEIPSSFMHNSLTDSANFSSVFGLGIVRSPFEFTITVMFLLIIMLIADKYFSEYSSESKTQVRHWSSFVVLTFVSLCFVLLTLRGFGASMRSVIFDSSIRYFKDFSLMPEPSVFLMCLNILLLGYCLMLFAMILLSRLFNSLPVDDKKHKYYWLIFLFVLFQLGGWLFDEMQSEPQGTPFIRLFYFTIIFLLVYFIPFAKKEYIKKFIALAFAASVISVSYLTYYNSEIERESLKTTAQEITRTNEGLVEFMVYQTLIKIQQDDNIADAFSNNGDLSSDAFIVWTKSMLYTEGIRSAVDFFDQKKNYIGGFQSSSLIPYSQVVEAMNQAKDSLKIIKQNDLYSERRTYYGSVPIKNDLKIIGYVSISAIYDEDYFNYPELPKFLNPSRAGISSAINFEKLKIFDFHNGDLVRSYGDVYLSEEDINKIKDAVFTDQNEAWMNLALNNETNLIYLLKINSPAKNKIIAVALEGKNFSWNLSDFFKIFFVHSLIILVLLLLYAAFKFKKIILLFDSYRSRLIGAFLVVSLVPLLIIAVYFRNLTESKNSELIEKRLIELSQQVETYLNYYSLNSQVNRQAVFEKAANDLNVSFSIFENKKLIYGSDKIYSVIGLLPEILNGNVYNKCVLGRNQNLFSKESFENFNVNTIYHRSQIGGYDFILQVSDLFNKVEVPLSDIELDIFLFGIFSLALILLVGFSTLLADQISSPIRKVTTATKSVGSGDLNVELHYKTRGEIKDLVDGFNLMVKRIKQSQADLAEMERETAWKEMAKQVAHEIKNPLTPMKLNVQQLIAAYKDKSPKFDSIFEKVTATIISQIETLKNIASEFSNFARMPRLRIERLNTVETIQEAVNLFEEEKRQIKFIHPEEAVMIDADSDQLKRTIVNLIRNSIQAHAENISVDLKSGEGKCILRVHDDGTGIDGENISKIFDDNFTTKKGGMGIGLGITKRFIESIGGNISVEGTSEKGTTFLITIPLAE